MGIKGSLVASHMEASINVNTCTLKMKTTKKKPTLVTCVTHVQVCSCSISCTLAVVYSIRVTAQKILPYCTLQSTANQNNAAKILIHFEKWEVYGDRVLSQHKHCSVCKLWIKFSEIRDHYYREGPHYMKEEHQKVCNNLRRGNFQKRRVCKIQPLLL